MANVQAALLQSVESIVADKAKFSPDVSGHLSQVGLAFLIQIVSDLDEIGERVTPHNVFSVLRERRFHKMATDVERDYTERLEVIKREKLQRLRDAGFGLSTDHVSFMKAVFRSRVKEQHPEIAVDDGGV